MNGDLTILQRFADPEVFETMTMGEKMTASLYTTVLGMLITFAALLIIWGLILVMSNILQSMENRKKPADVVSAPVVKPQAPAAPAPVAEEDDEELIAVITAAIAASMNTSIHNIVVSNIVRVSDSTPAWGKVGRADLMSTRF